MPVTIDVALIGGGVMSATLGTLLSELQPDWSITAFERLEDVALESSNAWNNAGTGHSALCELNYTPEREDGSVDPTRAVKINEQFQQTRAFWASLVREGLLEEPASFVNPTPHMTFVWGEEDVAFLRRRYEVLKDQPLFAGMEYSEDPAVIAEWAPLLMEGRDPSQPCAATRAPSGTDVDFGSLTRQLFDVLRERGTEVRTDVEVRSITRQPNGLWRLSFRNRGSRATHHVDARFVFVGAGGWALKLLQNSGIPEIRGIGCFPIGGQWLKTSNPEIVARHRAKVYAKPALGAPPMSVPHLDTRVVDGGTSLLFGPFATFSPKFLKKGRWSDLVTQIRPHNLVSMVKVGLTNLDLLAYLIRELLKTPRAKVNSLRDFMPTARDEDWELLGAGQRAQVMKDGQLQFGTEVVAHADGSIAGLLGASPGASTAVPIMLKLLETCFPDRIEQWRPRLLELVPSFGDTLNDKPEQARQNLTVTSELLDLDR